MAVHKGTPDDDDIIVTEAQAWDEFNGRDGDDTLVLTVTSGLQFFSFNGSTFNSIENVRFGIAPGALAATSWEYFNTPLVEPMQG